MSVIHDVGSTMFNQCYKTVLIRINFNMGDSIFDKLIWCTIGPKSFLFGTARFSPWASGIVNYDFIITNSTNSLLIGSRCLPNGAHTNHCWTKLTHASKHIKKLWWVSTMIPSFGRNNNNVLKTHWFCISWIVSALLPTPPAEREETRKM